MLASPSSLAGSGMLVAEREALKWEAHHASLDILEREMAVTLTLLSNVGTQSALVGGFAFIMFSGEYVLLSPAAQQHA